MSLNSKKGKKLEYPEKNNLDKTYEVSTEILSNVVGVDNPLLGLITKSLITQILPAPIEKRKKAFFIQVAEGINELKQKLELQEEVLNKKLQENEVFVSTVMELHGLVLKDHREEKLNKVKNMIFNSGKTENFRYLDYNKMFFSLSVDCIKVLFHIIETNNSTFRAKPKEVENGLWIPNSIKGFKKEFPTIHGRNDNAMRISNTLFNEAFLEKEPYYDSDTGQLSFVWLKPTIFAKDFYNYVSTHNMEKSTEGTTER